LGLKAIIEANPNKKDSIQKSLKENLFSILQKDAVSIGPLSILHRLILDYLTLCNDNEIQDVIELLKENLIHIIHTKEGSRVAQLCLLHSSPKNRKIILKSWKGFVTKIAKEEYGHVALITLFECVDDTVLVNKAIISELVKDGLGSEESFCALMRHKYASRVILYLLRGRQKKFLPSHIYEELFKNDTIRLNTTKKDQALREKELLEFISPFLIDQLLKNMNILIRSRTSGQIVAEASRHAIGGNAVLFESLSTLASNPINGNELQDTKEEVFHPIKKMKKEADLSQLQETLVMDDHVLMNRNATFVLKDIISGGSKDTVGDSAFVEVLFTSIKDQLKLWIEYCIQNPSKSSGTALVLLSMLENVSKDLKDDIFSTFKESIDPSKTKKFEASSNVKKPAIQMFIDILS
jgi:pumilio family protein 6